MFTLIENLTDLFVLSHDSLVASLVPAVSVTIPLTMVLIFSTIYLIPTPGKQASMLIGNMGDTSNEMWFKIKNMFKPKVAKDAQDLEEKFNTKCKRLRLAITYEDYKRGFRTGIKIGIFGVVILLAGMVTFIDPIVFTGFITILIGVFFTFAMPMTIASKNSALKTSIEKDILQLLYLYKYSDKSKSFHFTVEDFLPDSNSLRVDMEILLSDMNTIGEDAALNRWAERSNLKDVSEFVNIIKTAKVGNLDILTMNLGFLEKSVKDKKRKKMKKENDSRFKVLMTCALMALAGLALIFIAPIIVDIMQGMNIFG